MSCLQVYAGLITKGKSQEQAAELSADEKKRRVVLKRVNLDRVEVRANFLKSGTMAKVGCRAMKWNLALWSDSCLQTWLALAATACRIKQGGASSVRGETWEKALLRKQRLC